jgi:hypothetical protein
MQFNIVYTLFFATAIVCAGRGAGWWVAYLRRTRRERRQAGTGPRGAAAASSGSIAAEQTVTP